MKSFEELARKAMQDFVDKCDRGEARSRRSYAAFKEALAASSSAAPSDAVQRMEAAYSAFMQAEAFVGCSPRFIFGGGYRAALTAPAPTVAAPSKSALTCWECAKKGDCMWGPGCGAMPTKGAT